MKIALCGPPHSGKSVLRQRLKTAIHAIAPDIHPYVLSTNPDGEGAWFQEAYHQNPEHASALKTIAKQKWTPAHAEIYSGWVRDTKMPLTFIDMGGVVDDYSRAICAAATHSILLASKEQDLVPWRQFSAECSLTIVAELISAYESREDRVLSEAGVFRAEVHHLERGDLDSPREAVDKLADIIVGQLRRLMQNSA